MTTMDTLPQAPATPLWRRILQYIPILGWMLNDGDSDVANAWSGVVMIAALWGCSIMLFGYAGLIIPALFMVGVMFCVIVIISRG
ncbi:MAG: hypothetical protein AAGF71_10835 [Pseudomonadota bacterium]